MVKVIGKLKSILGQHDARCRHTTLSLLMNPKNAYKNLEELEAARDYAHFAFEEYHENVVFATEPSEKYDRRAFVRHKGLRNLSMYVYENPAIVRIGNWHLDNHVNSTNYAFELEPVIEVLKKDERLPDLEVIELTGLSHETNAVAEHLQNMYSEKGYKVKSLEMKLPQHKHGMGCRYSKQTRTWYQVEPEDLIKLATKHVDYDIHKFAFDTSQ